MRKLLILIFVTGVILDEPPPPGPPCVVECEGTHLKNDFEGLNRVEKCRTVQNLLNCVKESCKDPDISKRVYDQVNFVEKLDNEKCDPELSY